MKRALLGLLLVTVAFVGCTSGGDGDGLPADAEARGWTVVTSYPNGTQAQYNVTSDPSEADTDGDGLDDHAELQRGTDPRKIDTDEDRLLDGSRQCPEEGSDLHQRIQERDIVEHPEEEGCYLGESRTELSEFSYRSSPIDAHSDSSPQLSDTLADGTELVGWEVDPVDGEPYHVRSNPGLENADSDSDGLHDGLEKRLSTDPLKDDTDEDGVPDLNDAAPLGDLHVTVHILSLDLKEDYQLRGGADLFVEASQGDASATKGPQEIGSGDNELDWSLQMDVSDEGSGFVEELGGAHASGNWEKEITLQFWHEDEDGEAIEVRSSDDGNGNYLFLTYDAFEDSWTGHAEGGTSEGPDADVTVDVSSRIE